MTSQAKTIETDNLIISVTRKPGCMVYAEMEVSPAAAQAAYSKALKTINKEVSIPGFRKGKAPESLIKDRFQKQIEVEWRDVVLNTAFKEYLNETSMYPHRQGGGESSFKRAEVHDLSLDKGAKVILEYEAQVEVPTVDPASLEITEIELDPVTEGDIDLMIRQIQLSHAEWTDVEGRPVQEGDFVDISIIAQENPPREVAQSARLEIAPGRSGQWIQRLVLDRNVGETVEGTSELEDGHVDPKDFKPVLCSITINKIMTGAIPPLDDELAKKLKLSSIEDLRPRVLAELQQRAADLRQNRLRSQVETQLLEKYVFDIPVSIIKENYNNLMAQRLPSLKNIEDKQKRQEMVKEMEESTWLGLERSYRLSFLIQALAETNIVQLQEQDIQNELMRMLAASPQMMQKFYSMDSESRQRLLYSNVMTSKVLDYLAQHAVYIK